MTDELTCKELVELVTDYLEGSLPPSDRRRFEEHLVVCDGCTSYLESISLTIRVAGRLTEGDLLPEMEQALVATFRDWKRG